MPDRDVDVFRADFKMIENQSDLLVRRRQKEVRAICVSRIVTGIPGRIEFPTFARGTAISKAAAAIRRCGTWYLVFRLKSIPAGDKEKFYSLT